MTELDELTAAAEAEWLDRFTAGPTEGEAAGPVPGDKAPDLILPDHTGRLRSLSEFWADGPALVLFWRHFGCNCGVGRAQRLRAEWSGYLAAGLHPVIVGQGEPARAAAYRTEHGLPAVVLSDPDFVAYRAYGIRHWQVEQVLYDAQAEIWTHRREVGVEMQRARRASGRPLVDDPWRPAAEFVVQADGRIRLAYRYQYCTDYPEPRVLTTAARLIEPA
jgi:peroxiredoxin